MEALEGRRAGVGVARRHQITRAARLAHRMLGNELETPRRDLRYPWGRHRSGVSPPRERDRAVALRVAYGCDGEHLDAQWLPAGRRREDVEVPRQFLHDPRGAGRL